MESPYDVLGIDPDADEAEVDRAFRRRVIETHPDQGGSQKAFQRVMAAYETITAERPDAVIEGEDAEVVDGENAGVVDGEDAEGIDGEADGVSRSPAQSRVRYLNYEVLDDHGWSLDDDDLFEKAAAAGLDEADYGRITVSPDHSLLEAAEDCGFAWPYSCRGGACANCAVAVTEGDMAMSIDNVLTDDLLDRGIRLSCIGAPTTGEVSVVYNVKHIPAVEELLLPPGPFAEAQGDD